MSQLYPVLTQHCESNVQDPPASWQVLQTLLSQ
jgi:hypothetical protein